MGTYFDKKAKTWYCQFRYKDYTGEIKQKRKRGFKLQREAKDYEREFLEKEAKNLSMTFESFLELYKEDLSHRLKPKTLLVKHHIISKHILPYFKNKKMNEITAVDIRQWQNTLMADFDFSQSYLRKINGILNAIFNYASIYYDLKTNPCLKAGSIGSNERKKICIYTLDQFYQLLDSAVDFTDYTIFSILYFTGMRKGELFALTKKDIDFENNTITISKSCQRIAKKYIYTSPKTKNSYRTVDIPSFLVDIIKQYCDKMYDVKDSDYLFSHHLVKLRGRLKIAQKSANLSEAFTVHCFRHSHVSLLIELGYSPALVADRIGDNVDTVLKVYSHLYPTSKEDLIKKLDNLKK